MTHLLLLPFKRETAVPMLALTFASIICVALVLTRIIWTRQIHYGFLIWNLFLAWVPLMFAMVARDLSRRGRERTWRFWGIAGAWLLFFPNAPYILTDLTHLTTKFYRHFWIDMTLILTCAFTGLVLGFVSLYLMHSVVTQRFGRFAGWLFVAVCMGLCSFGIYIGRFLRFNSWDIFLRPDKIYRGLETWLQTRVPHMSSTAFLILFATFLFVTYVMLYALTHLPRHQSIAYEPGANPSPSN
jgi:uncharacterized membrane protein